MCVFLCISWCIVCFSSTSSAHSASSLLTTIVLCLLSPSVHSIAFVWLCKEKWKKGKSLCKQAYFFFWLLLVLSAAGFLRYRVWPQSLTQGLSLSLVHKGKEENRKVSALSKYHCHYGLIKSSDQILLFLGKSKENLGLSQQGTWWFSSKEDIFMCCCVGKKTKFHFM